MGFGSVALLGIGLAVEDFPPLLPVHLSVIMRLAVVNTAFAFNLGNMSLQTLFATESPLINNSLMVQIAALAWFFLGETPGPLDLLGLVLANLRPYRAQ